MTGDRDRVISISLSEAEWQAFVARHPQPVSWLRDRIRAEVAGHSTAGIGPAEPAPQRPQATTN